MIGRHQMASFKERAGGTVWVRVSVKIDGKYKQLTHTAANMEEAKLWAARQEAGQKLESKGGQGMTVFELHCAYMNRTPNPSTKAFIKYCLNRALNWFGGVNEGDSLETKQAKRNTLMPHNITPNKVEEYLRQPNYDFNTLRCDILYLRRILRIGGFNHLDGVRIGGERVKPKRLITQEEYQQLLNVAMTKHIWMIRLLFESGWRRGEVFNLRPCDLRFGSNPVADFLDVKSGEPRVRVMTEGCQAVLMDLVAEHIRQGKDQYTRFCTYHNPREISQMILRYRRRAGLGDHVHPHAFRHRFITAAQSNAGLTAKEVMLYTGHTDVNTVNRYTQPDPKLAQEKMRRISHVTPSYPDPNFFMK